MKKGDRLYQQYLDILREELRPAMGCTEPIALAYAAAEADAARVAEARDAYDSAVKQLDELESHSAILPAREEAEKKLQ